MTKRAFIQPRILATGVVRRDVITTTIELFERVEVDVVKCRVCECDVGLAGHPNATDSSSTDAGITSHLRSAGHRRGIRQLERFGHSVTDYAIIYRKARG